MIKHFIFLLVIISPIIRIIIFKSNSNPIFKHIIWNIFKWKITLLIVLNYKLPLKVTLESLIYGLTMFLISVLYFILSSFIFRFRIFKGLSEIYNLPLILRILGGLSAGITEEVIYRNFLVLFLDEFFGNLLISCFLSSLIFGIFHIPLWGFFSSIQIFIWSIMFYIYFLVKGELFALIVAHSLNDIFFFLKTPITNKFFVKKL